MLIVRGIETFHGPSQALFGVDLEVRAGEAVALMGRNGMGKTTTIRSICGLERARRGEIRFNGKEITRLPAYRVARLGLGLVPEGRRCFANLSVRENLLVTARPGPYDLARTSALFPRLAERGDQLARTLSGGEQQMLSIGRALMTNPELLILDEATEGLAPLVRREIWRVLRHLKDGGQSLLVVDKSLKDLLALADRCVVLERGRPVWTGAPADLDAELRNRYLGV
jgi:branched-chain amino acid transport system ATP-binding protein